MSGNADGGQGREPYSDPPESGGERLTEIAREKIAEKRARRAAGVRFSDGVVQGIEPTPAYSNPVHDYMRSRRGT